MALTVVLLISLCSPAQTQEPTPADAKPADTGPANFAAAATGHQPVSDERFAPYHKELVTSARALEKALRRDCRSKRASLLAWQFP